MISVDLFLMPTHIHSYDGLEMIIWLSGPTGAGKTSLTRSLRESGYFIVSEDIPDELFRAFVAEPTRNCEPLQRYIMQARFDGWRNRSGALRIAFDRSIDEDIGVFCEMHRRAGLLTRQQFEALSKLGKSLQDQIPPPDLIVLLPRTNRFFFGACKIWQLRL